MSATRKPPKPLVTLRDALPATPSLPQEAPPLQREPVHKRLARATKRQADLVEQIRQLKAEWSAKNIKAQATRIPIATSEITYVETKRRELQSQLMAAQAEIGECNCEIRQNKAKHQGNGNGNKPQPLKNHPTFDRYFRLSAENLLPPGLLKQVEADAKTSLAHALSTGVEG